MTDIYKLFEKETWKPQDYTSFVYVESIDELSYNTDSDVDHLMNTDGNTYSFMIQGYSEKEGLAIYDLKDDYGGDAFQAIFDLSKKVDEDKYWDSVGNEDEEE